MGGRLDERQRKMVEEHMDVINRVIRKYIHINQNIYGMEYDDIYQVGAIGLCKAAFSYQNTQKASFSTYAFRVVLNTLYDYLRSLQKKQELMTWLQSEPEAYAQYRIEEDFHRNLSENAILRALHESKEHCSNTAKKGIEMIELKARGYSGRDIADKYSVSPNYITACISRARKYLLNQTAFLERIV